MGPLSVARTTALLPRAHGRPTVVIEVSSASDPWPIPGLESGCLVDKACHGDGLRGLGQLAAYLAADRLISTLVLLARRRRCLRQLEADGGDDHMSSTCLPSKQQVGLSSCEHVQAVRA